MFYRRDRALIAYTATAQSNSPCVQCRCFFFVCVGVCSTAVQHLAHTHTQICAKAITIISMPCRRCTRIAGEKKEEKRTQAHTQLLNINIYRCDTLTHTASKTVCPTFSCRLILACVCVLLMMWPAGELLFIVDVRCCRENGALHTCREY